MGVHILNLRNWHIVVWLILQCEGNRKATRSISRAKACRMSRSINTSYGKSMRYPMEGWSPF